MAKKAAGGESYRNILQAVKKGEYAPVYILMGEESYYIDLVANALENNAVHPDEKDFNCNIFYGQDADLDMVMTAAKQFPMMAERRLVMLKEAQSMTNARTQLDKLEPYLKRPNPTCVLVIIYKGEALAATSKLMKAAKGCGAVVMNSAKIRDYEIAGHIRDLCASRRINVDPKALAMLSEFLGANMSKIAGEIDKLQMVAGNKANLTITPEMVEKHIGVSKDYNSFELTSALATMDYVKAMKIADAFERNPKNYPVVQITSVLFNFYQKMAIVAFLPDRSDASLMKALDVKSAWALKDVKAAMRYFTPTKAIRSIALLREFDAQTKGIGSMQNEHQLLKQLIFNLFTAK